MSRGEEQNSQHLSEELEFLTACLIGKEVSIQTKSLFFAGTVEAAKFDSNYGMVIHTSRKNGLSRKIKICLKDVVYICAKNVSLHIDKDTMLTVCANSDRMEVVTGISQSSRTEGESSNLTGVHSGEHPNVTVQNAMSMAGNRSTETNQLPIRPTMQSTQRGEGLSHMQLTPQLTPGLVSDYQCPNVYGHPLRIYSVAQTGPQNPQPLQWHPYSQQYPWRQQYEWGHPHPLGLQYAQGCFYPQGLQYQQGQSQYGWDPHGLQYAQADSQPQGSQYAQGDSYQQGLQYQQGQSQYFSATGHQGPHRPGPPDSDGRRH